MDKGCQDPPPVTLNLNGNGKKKSSADVKGQWSKIMSGGAKGSTNTNTRSKTKGKEKERCVLTPLRTKKPHSHMYNRSSDPAIQPSGTHSPKHPTQSSKTVN